MFSPLLLTLAYLSVTFLLGLLFGWVLWKFNASADASTSETEVQFWKERSEQSRLELDLEQSKATDLKKQLDDLKRQLRSA